MVDLGHGGQERAEGEMPTLEPMLRERLKMLGRDPPQRASIGHCAHWDKKNAEPSALNQPGEDRGAAIKISSTPERHRAARD